VIADHRHRVTPEARPEVLKGATVPSVNEWPEGWHPVNAAEAQEYIDAHQQGGGDAELLEECQSFLPINPRPS
jgi:hypothetical protein